MREDVFSRQIALPQILIGVGKNDTSANDIFVGVNVRNQIGIQADLHAFVARRKKIRAVFFDVTQIGNPRGRNHQLEIDYVVFGHSAIHQKFFCLPKVSKVVHKTAYKPNKIFADI